jgi:hypothetical protein
MKTWIIASIIFGVLIIGGMAVVNAISDNSSNTIIEPVAEKTISCSSCGNGCTAENNCGVSTCGAVSGTGSCGCGGQK